MLLRCFDEFIVRTIDSIWEPPRFLEAASNSRWKFVMLEEMELISHDQTWQLVQLPPKKKSIIAKWIYKVKNNSSGKLSKYKVKLVAKGFE
jgi:histone deacetylase 1/2